MARDYEDLHNIEELDDNELRELVREQLREHARWTSTRSRCWRAMAR